MGAPRQTQAPLCTSVSPHFTVGTETILGTPSSRFSLLQARTPAATGANVCPHCIHTQRSPCKRTAQAGPTTSCSGKHCAGPGLNNHELQSRCAALREADAAPGLPTPTPTRATSQCPALGAADGVMSATCPGAMKVSEVRELGACKPHPVLNVPRELISYGQLGVSSEKAQPLQHNRP